MLITLLGACVLIVGLMTFVSRSQMCQKYKLQIVLFNSSLDTCVL